MSDPYKVLGVPPTATDEEVKTAYRELAKKYHPDNYADSPLADLAGEKMKEVNEAYDQVMNERRRGKNGQTGGYQTGGYQSGGYQPGGSRGNPYQGQYGSYGYGNSSSFPDVRSLIMNGRIADAEQILNGVPSDGRNAEWFFLKGTVLYKRGWLDEAYNHFTRASQMEPGNIEYRSAMNQVMNQRNGGYGGYNPAGQTGGCTTCDICNGLICADCCCECMGGDLIPCC